MQENSEKSFKFVVERAAYSNLLWLIPRNDSIPLKYIIYMKRLFLLLIATLSALISASAARPRNVANMHDVDLVYYGSRYRSISWDEDWARTHVAYTDSTGQTHYLFDTFLLLELHTGSLLTLRILLILVLCRVV